MAIESLATGTPVIARRAGALPEIVEHGVDGFLVDDLREARIAVRLAAGLDRTRIRERAIARFDVDRMVTAYERLYRTLVTGAGAGAGADEPARRPGLDGQGRRHRHGHGHLERASSEQRRLVVIRVGPDPGGTGA